MFKNTASQSIGAQMITAADGSVFTGAVTVAVTGDSGAQATGSVGSGACTHEGGGYHSYRPAQAETNYDHVAFTFSGTGAISVTVQVFTRAGDAFTRLGAPAGASVSADIAAVKVDTAAILVDTGTTLDARIPAALVSGRMDCSVGAMAANVMTAAAAAADLTTELQSGLATSAALDAVDNFLDTEVAAILAAVDTEVAAIKAVTDLLPDAGALTSLATQASVNTIDDFLDTEIAAIKAKTDQLTFTVANQVDANALTVDEDEILDDALIDSVPADGALPTVRQALYMLTQFMFERSVSGTTLTVNKADGTTALMTFTLNDGTSPTAITRAT